MEITEALIILSKLEKCLPKRYNRIKQALNVLMQYISETQKKIN